MRNKSATRTKCIRIARGTSIAETGASMSLLIPVVMTILFVLVEACYAIFLGAGLSECARVAARNLAITYGQNPLVASDRATQDAIVFQYIHMTNVVNSTAQFDDPVFDTAKYPHTVSVNVHYASGKYGLPTFPFAGPLNLGTAYVPHGQSTYRLE